MFLLVSSSLLTNSSSPKSSNYSCYKKAMLNFLASISSSKPLQLFTSLFYYLDSLTACNLISLYSLSGGDSLLALISSLFMLLNCKDIVHSQFLFYYLYL